MKPCEINEPEPRVIQILRTIETADLMVNWFGFIPPCPELERSSAWILTYVAALQRSLDTKRAQILALNDKHSELEDRFQRFEESLGEDGNRWSVLATDDTFILFVDKTGRVARLGFKVAQSLSANGNVQGSIRVNGLEATFLIEGIESNRVPLSLIAALTSGQISISGSTAQMPSTCSESNGG